MDEKGAPVARRFFVILHFLAYRPEDPNIVTDFLCFS